MAKYKFENIRNVAQTRIMETDTPDEVAFKLARDWRVDADEVWYELLPTAPSVRGFPGAVDPTVKALSAEVDELRLECKRLKEENARLRKGFDELKAMIKGY